MRRHYVVVMLVCGLVHCKPLRHQGQNKTGEGQTDKAALPLVEIKLETDKNKALSFDLRRYNSEQEANVVYTLEPTASHGSLSFQTDDAAQVTYTPRGGYVGEEILSYGLLGKPEIARGRVVISLTNQVPHAQNIDLTVAPHSEVTLALVGFDPDEEAVSYELVQEAKNGEINFDAKGGWLDYKARQGFEGDEVMSYIAKDAYSSSAPATITIHVASDPGQVASLTMMVIKNSEQTIQLKAPPGSGSYQLVRPPKHGTLDKLESESGRVVYIPAQGYVGSDDFTYSVKDDKGAKKVLTVSLNVANRIPLITSVPVYEHLINQASTKDIKLAFTVRDFKSSHPDFVAAYNTGVAISDMVEGALNSKGKPVYAGKDYYGLVKDRESFSQWFSDEAINCRHSSSIEFPYDSAASLARYTANSFFPADKYCFGNEGQPHNFLFTVELHSSFVYQATDRLVFSSDDDLWAFIDGKLVIDLGGRHGQLSKAVNLADVAPRLGLQPGKSYELSIFYADRGPQSAKFSLETTMALRSTPLYQYQLKGHDADGDTLRYELISGPVGMNLDQQSGILRWAPRLRDEGVHMVKLAVHDGSQETGKQDFALKIKREL